jgi:hypothetical protein
MACRARWQGYQAGPFGHILTVRSTSAAGRNQIVMPLEIGFAAC